MKKETKQITVAKVTENEVNELENFLQALEEKVKDNDHLDLDNDRVNSEIGKIVRETFPFRASFMVPLNLKILLDNYQNKDSKILQHPKWLVEIYEKLVDINTYLSKQDDNEAKELKEKLQIYFE